MNPEDQPMTAMPYQPPEQDWDEYEDEHAAPLPSRPRRRWWTPWTGIVLAVLLGAIGFYVGVRVEKSQLSNSASTTGLTGATGAAGARAGAASGTRGGGLGAGLAARFGGGGNATFGTVSAVSGGSLYVTDATGNTVKVTFNSATKVTKSVGVSKSAIRPGDTVVIQGLKGSGGEINATSVSDSGARSSSFGGGSSSSSSSSGNSASSAVGSLFGGGG
jgi:Domain of unknown function (DUF5666)